jgi:outer membrane protein OmpA-like peptidoglycan-associated protein
MPHKFIVSGLLLLFLFGCAGEPKQLQMKDIAASPSEPEKAMKTVEFPKGTVFGGASTEQAGVLAQTFVDSHNMAMEQFSKALQNQETLKAGQKSLKEGQEAIKKSIDESNQKIMAQGQQNLEKAQQNLQMLEQLSRKQGTGEITLFFPVGQTRLKEKTVEYDRLIHFVDFLSRESRGRKILLIGIGSSSSIGKRAWNMKLAQARAEFPKTVIDKYLVNVPHEFYKVYGTGDLYTPKGLGKKQGERYQHTRLIALYETDQTPALPEEPAKN